MATNKKDKKKRKPKGKSLSQKLEEKELARASEEEEDAAEDDDASDEDLAEPEAASDDDDAEYDDDDAEEDDDDAEYEDDDAEYEDDDDDEDDASDGEEEDDDEDDDDEELAAAAQMGVQRYVMAGFFGFWIVVSYIIGRAIESLWAEVATRQWALENAAWLSAVEDEGTLVSRANIALLMGVLVGGAVVLRYYRDADTRTYADEVAEQLGKVKWPTRKQVGNNTVVVIISTTILTAYLTLLDQFWKFVTDLIYTGGA